MADTSKEVADILILRGQRIPVRVMEVPHASLQFFLDNPRLYTLVRDGGNEPTQDEIQEVLTGMEHVKQLVLSIKDNGGLIDPIIVRGGTNVVLEGNSRLAAYRILARTDPIKWGHIRVKVLPESIGEDEIFSLLGEYHIIGKKDWAPYEQAGYLYRRRYTHGVSVDDLARSINLGKNKIEHLISVYQFMLDIEESDVGRWSYYDEYLKSTKIAKARGRYPDMDDIVIGMIQSGEIARAVDVRDDLKKIVEAGGRVLERFATGKRSFEDSVDAALDKGVGEQGVRRVKKFKEWLATQDAQNEILRLDGEPRKRCIFELKKIETLIDRVLKKLNAK